MLRRALLVVVVISYLTCVLYLSGLQKTESNANSLRKSQGRSVNIRNENNENADTNVLSNSSVANEIGIDKSPHNVPAAELPSEELGSKYHGSFEKTFDYTNASDIHDISIDYVLFKNAENNNGNHNGTNLRDRRTVEDEDNLEEASASNENDNRENKRLHIINPDNHTKIIQYTEEKPNLRKVITFWQKLVSRNHETTTKTPFTNAYFKSNDTVTTTIKININTTKVPTNIYSKSQTIDLRKSKKTGVNSTVDDEILGGDFDMMLSEYISKESTRLPSSTTVANKLKPIDDDTDIFNDLLNAPNKDSSEMHKINAHMSKYSYEFKYAKFKWPAENAMPEKKSRKSMQSGKELQDMFVKDFNNLEQNVLNKATTLQSSISNEDDYDKYTKENTKSADKVSTVPIYTVLEANNKVTTTPLPDVIKQLAENVKNLIIKDLVTTTTDVTTAATIPDLGGNKNYVVIEKIMELLQKYKTEMNHNAVSTTELTKVTIPSTTEAIHPKKKKTPKKTNLSKTNNSNRLSNHKKKAKLENLKSQPIISIYLPPQVSSNIATDFKSSPITIQTNLLEIPPLGVPISNPGSIISHNIIITTIRPYVQNIMNYPNSYEMLLKNHQISNRNKMEKTRERSIRKEEECNGADAKKKIKMFRATEHEPVDDSNDVILVPKKHKKNPTRYENVHGFHEKFEHYQQSHGDIDDLLRDDCSKEELFQREPIKYIKRGNDAAFKKLLRSQQRVTDMLEQMLARKNDDPMVETT